MKLWLAMGDILTKLSVGDGIGVSGWLLLKWSGTWPLDSWSVGPWRTACWIELLVALDDSLKVDDDDATVDDDSDEAPANKKFPNVTWQILCLKNENFFCCYPK